MNKLMNQMKIALFPLPGAILFPGMQLPLHIFEPRYQAMINESLARDRMIGMIQPQSSSSPSDLPALFSVGCLGRMADIEAMDDGRYNIILEGVRRFTIDRELDVNTAFRQAEVTLWDEGEDESLASAERASLEIESRKFADTLGYSVDWDAVTQLDDTALVNAIAQVAPFDTAAKQACLEAKKLSERSELIIQLMQFFGAHDDDNDRVTLQ
jgi:Lon protease-like protein